MAEPTNTPANQPAGDGLSETDQRYFRLVEVANKALAERDRLAARVAELTAERDAAVTERDGLRISNRDLAERNVLVELELSDLYGNEDRESVTRTVATRCREIAVVHGLQWNQTPVAKMACDGISLHIARAFNLDAPAAAPEPRQPPPAPAQREDGGT